MTVPSGGVAGPSPSSARAAAEADIGGGRRGQFMKRVYFRRAGVAADASPAVAADKIAAARAALASAPDERGKHKELARLLAVNGQLDELGDVLARWATRDPLDADGIVARADLLARQGDREGALRVLGGALAAPALSTNDAATLASAVALAHERAGSAEACAFRVAAAELRPGETDIVARAVLCERARGRGASADRWLLGLKDDAGRKAVNLQVAKVSDAMAKGENAQSGDFVLSATWDGLADVDLDLALLTPDGARASWASPRGTGGVRSVRVNDPKSRTREALAVSAGGTGSFVVEIVRANGSTAPVSGTLIVRALGTTQAIPFTLGSSVTRQSVARVDVRMDSELVPVDGISDDAIITSAPPFDRGAAARVLNVAAAGVRTCGSQSGPTGTGRVRVTFAGTGNVRSASVDSPFAGSSVGMCVESRFRLVRITPFSGGDVTVSKSFSVD
jgi:hypothetical protein